jgi:hypothetical protein
LSPINNSHLFYDINSHFLMPFSTASFHLALDLLLRSFVTATYSFS